MEETSMEVGDVLQVIALRPIEGIEVPCHIVGEYQSVLNSGRSLISSKLTEDAVWKFLNEHPEREALTLLVDSFVAEQYRQVVKHPTEYKFTALYADLVCGEELGLMYPSVAANHGINLAVSGKMFDAVFEVLFTEVFKIEKYFGYGVYERKLIRASCDFEEDGTIQWNSPKGFVYEFSLGSGMRIDDSFRGWRPPQAANTSQSSA